MPQNNKAYVTIVSFGQSGSNPNYPRVTSSNYVVVDSGNNVVSFGANSPVAVDFSYGDSGQAIRQAVAEAIRIREADPNLDVNFV